MSISFPKFLGPFEGLLILLLILYFVALGLAVLVTLKSRDYSPIDKLIRIVLIVYLPIIGIILVFYERKNGKL